MTGTKMIETERLILRRYMVSDAEDMYRNWAGDPEVTKFMPWPRHESAEATREILREWVSYYDGDLEELRRAVEKVVPHWVNFFGEGSRVYCGFVDGKIASFCQIVDFGEHEVNGQVWKIGGPGCVGTVPEYRDRGIGLTMVKNVTKILRDEFYDQSYVHYTYETGWYGKLGYETFLRWNGKGFA